MTRLQAIDPETATGPSQTIVGWCPEEARIYPQHYADHGQLASGASGLSQFFECVGQRFALSKAKRANCISGSPGQSMRILPCSAFGYWTHRGSQRGSDP